jgi:murein L,D-transpeptidase YafK
MSASLALAATPARKPVAIKADQIVLLKHKRVLALIRGGRVLKTYRVALGLHPVGPKLWEGDGKTPEGTYLVDGRNEASRYHLALHISYPGPADEARALAAHRSAGSAIMIHGMPNWFSDLTMRLAPDWTSGCIAVSNDAIEEIWDAVDDGTPIEIRP